MQGQVAGTSRRFCSEKQSFGPEVSSAPLAPRIPLASAKSSPAVLGAVGRPVWVARYSSLTRRLSQVMSPSEFDELLEDLCRHGVILVYERSPRPGATPLRHEVWLEDDVYLDHAETTWTSGVGNGGRRCLTAYDGCSRKERG